MAEVRFEAIRKTFGNVTAVDDVDLHVAEGEFVVLLGPSGCGKTTLLRCLAGLERVDSGRILIGDRDATDLPPRRRCRSTTPSSASSESARVTGVLLMR